MKGAISNLLCKFLLGQDEEELEYYLDHSKDAWTEFFLESQNLEGEYSGIDYEIKTAIKEILGRNKVECQHCRLDYGLAVSPPLRPEYLCKRHLQIFEENNIDRTNHPRPPRPTWIA
jgi:hypothetical protein